MSAEREHGGVEPAADRPERRMRTAAKDAFRRLGDGIACRRSAGRRDDKPIGQQRWIRFFCSRCFSGKWHSSMYGGRRNGKRERTVGVQSGKTCPGQTANPAANITIANRHGADEYRKRAELSIAPKPRPFVVYRATGCVGYRLSATVSIDDLSQMSCCCLYVGTTGGRAGRGFLRHRGRKVRQVVRDTRHFLWEVSLSRQRTACEAGMERK